MLELLLNKNLLSSPTGSDVRKVAKARTLTALRRVGGRRKMVPRSRNAVDLPPPQGREELSIWERLFQRIAHVDRRHRSDAVEDQHAVEMVYLVLHRAGLDPGAPDLLQLAEQCQASRPGHVGRYAGKALAALSAELSSPRCRHHGVDQHQ